MTKIFITVVAINILVAICASLLGATNPFVFSNIGIAGTIAGALWVGDSPDRGAHP